LVALRAALGVARLVKAVGLSEIAHALYGAPLLIHGGFAALLLSLLVLLQLLLQILLLFEAFSLHVGSLLLDLHLALLLLKPIVHVHAFKLSVVAVAHVFVAVLVSFGAQASLEFLPLHFLFLAPHSALLIRSRLLLLWLLLLWLFLLWLCLGQNIFDIRQVLCHGFRHVLCHGFRHVLRHATSLLDRGFSIVGDSAHKAATAERVLGTAEQITKEASSLLLFFLLAAIAIGISATALFWSASLAKDRALAAEHSMATPDATALVTSIATILAVTTLLVLLGGSEALLVISTFLLLHVELVSAFLLALLSVLLTLPVAPLFVVFLLLLSTIICLLASILSFLLTIIVSRTFTAIVTASEQHPKHTSAATVTFTASLAAAATATGSGSGARAGTALAAVLHLRPFHFG